MILPANRRLCTQEANLELSSMPATLIPWQAFFEELQKENSQTVQTWLVRWTFTDGGAVLVHVDEKHEAAPLSREEKKKRALLFLMALERASRTLH